VSSPATLGGGRKLALYNQSLFRQSASAISINVPFITRTGKFLFRLVCGDSSGAVEGPYTITYDSAGANLALTQHKVGSGGEGSSRSRVVIASLVGAPVTGLSKNITFAMTASLMSNFIVLVHDLPAWWSGTIGNVDASGANGSVNSYSSPPIVTGVRNSLVCGVGGCVDGTLGALAIAGQGSIPWHVDLGIFIAAAALNWNGIFGSKIVPNAGVTLDTNVYTVGGGVSLNWCAGLIELRP
jgi:hypothetical protein